MDEFNVALMEETVGFQKKRAVVMIGRMNPPTAGHYKVIDAMKAFIRKNKNLNLESTPIVVVVAGDKTSSDLSKNPLSAEDRIKFMKASGRANGVLFTETNNAFSGFEEVRKMGFEPIAIAAGSDRADKYLELLNKYFTNNGEQVKHYAVSGLDREDPDEGTKGNLNQTLKDLKNGGELNSAEISGSMARAAVNAGYEDVFAKIVGLEQKPKLSKLLFDKIKKAMGGS